MTATSAKDIAPAASSLPERVAALVRTDLEDDHPDSKEAASA